MIGIFFIKSNYFLHRARLPIFGCERTVATTTAVVAAAEEVAAVVVVVAVEAAITATGTLTIKPNFHRWRSILEYFQVSLALLFVEAAA